MRIGAIVFDPGTNVRGSDGSAVALIGGWASIGGTPARRIQGVASLPSDVIWLTNLDYTAFSATRLYMHSNFRNLGWLRTRFEQIADEFGLGTNTGKAKETAETVALIAHRVVAYSCKELGVRVKGPRLNDDFSDMLGLDRCRLTEQHYAAFESIAGHPNVTVVQSVSYGRGAPTLTLRVNRLRYARTMLSYRVPPDTGWTLVKNRMSDDELDRLEIPFIVRCRITDVKPLMAETLSWGSGSKSLREWLTPTEWRVVRKHAQVEARSVILCEQGYASQDSYAAKLPTGPLAELSYSLGLVGEQLWSALMNKQPRANGQTGYTARAAWMRAVDRMTMFDYAQRLAAKRGITLVGYGMGNVVVRVPEGGLEAVLEATTDVGLMPPMSCFKNVAVGAVA